MSSVDFCEHVCRRPSRSGPKAWLLGRCFSPGWEEKSKVTSPLEHFASQALEHLLEEGRGWGGEGVGAGWGGKRRGGKRSIWSCRASSSFHGPFISCPWPATSLTFSCICEFQWTLISVCALGRRKYLWLAICLNGFHFSCVIYYVGKFEDNTIYQNKGVLTNKWKAPDSPNTICSGDQVVH